MYLNPLNSSKIALFLIVIAVGIQLPFAQRPIPRNFSLQVSGQVRFAGTRLPAEGALIRIESFNGGVVSQVITDRTGKFTFTGLNPLQYVVTVHLPGYFDYRERVDLATANSGYLSVELVEDKNAIGKENPADDKHRLKSPGVLSTEIPVAAQDELAKAKSDLAQNKRSHTMEAIKHLEKAVAIYPGYLDAQLMLGLARMDLGQWEKAEGPLRDAVKINPRASTAYFALGEVLRRSKKYPDAESVLAEGLKLAPDSAKGHLTIAKVLWEMAPSSKNEEQFRAAAQAAWKEVSLSLKYEPNLAEAHLLAGNILLQARRTVNALEHFEEYLKIEPNGEFADAARAVVKRIKAKPAGKN